MAGFVGADVERLRALAASMDQAGSRLASSASTIDVSVHRSAAWHGPSADRFRSRWTSNDRPRLMAASRDLHEAARKLRSNADEQERASGAAGSGRTSRPVGGVNAAPAIITSTVRSAWRLFDAFRPGVDHFSSWLGAANHVAQSGGLLSRTIDDVQSIRRAVDTGIITEKSGSQALRTALSGFVAGGGDELGKELQRLVGAADRVGQPTTGLRDFASFTSKLDKIGTVFGAASAVGADIEFFRNAAHGQVTPSDALSTIGTNLKLAKPLYGLGVAASVYGTLVGEAGKTDFSASGIASTNDYMVKHPADAIAAAFGGIFSVDTGKKVLGWF